MAVGKEIKTKIASVQEHAEDYARDGNGRG